MKALEDKILAEGIVLPGNVLKVGSFLNQQLDIAFLRTVGEEIARIYDGQGVNKVMTIEASGIAIATLAALSLGASAVVVKKHASANQSKDVYAAQIASYTHGNTYTAAVAKEYLLPTDRVLIVDDFLACGNAIKGMKEMIDEAGATLVGCAVAIEKKFQGGGDALRADGLRVDSLAMISGMTDSTVTFYRP